MGQQIQTDIKQTSSKLKNSVSTSFEYKSKSQGVVKQENQFTAYFRFLSSKSPFAIEGYITLGYTKFIQSISCCVDFSLLLLNKFDGIRSSLQINQQVGSKHKLSNDHAQPIYSFHRPSQFGYKKNTMVLISISEKMLLVAMFFFFSLL